MIPPNTSAMPSGAMSPDTPPGTPDSPSMLPAKQGLGSVMRDAWRLASPYYLRSEERWSARLLLVTVIAMNFILVAINVQLNTWNGAIFNSLQQKSYQGFIDLLLLGYKEPSGWMIGFTPLAGSYILIAIYRTYLRQWLEIRWRRWFTERTLTAWMSDRAYYTIGLQQGAEGTDNPDQRISEDLNSFTTDTVTLSLSLLSNIVSLISFASILWALSGDGVILGVTIPGYLLWIAVLYAVIGTGLTHLIGRPLAALEFQRQRVEADFRFGLVRVRENAEGVALYGGEAAERANLMGRFVNVVANVRATMTRVKKLTALNAGYSQVAGIFPLIVVSPKYFAGTIELGGMMRVVGAFSEVQGALSWFVDAYPQLARWRATVGRLTGFNNAIETAKQLAQGGVRVAPGSVSGLSLDGVTLALPDGRTLLDDAALSVPRGRSTVVSGRSGSGKSTLFRAIAGIWPFGGGTVQRPQGHSLFLPQKPYIPLGTLRQVVTYPAPPGTIDDTAVTGALTDVGLGALVPELDTEAPWAQRLSGGEQQRLAVARALLLRPDWLYLDEATASLDPEGEAELYRLLRTHLPETTIVSIAHRPEVAQWHDDTLVFSEGALKPPPVLTP
jgi:putative ATP-binding cassette transporter